MKTLRGDRRSRRAFRPTPEYLDDRMVPSAVPVAAGPGVEAVVAVSAAGRHEDHLAVLEREHEKAVARHDLRLARREARFLAHHPNAIAPTPSPNASGMLPANVSAPLQSLYTQYETYESSGGAGPFRPTGANLLVINGTDVGIQVKDTSTGDFNTLITELQGDGMQILDSSSTYGLVEGMLPIAQLPTVAQLPQTLSVTPMTNPSLGMSA
jgi:hypothetical protein